MTTYCNKPVFTDHQLSLNQTMFTNPEIFSATNNCFKLASKDISKLLGLGSHTTIVRQRKKLKDVGVARLIYDAMEQPTLMIDPDFYFQGKQEDKPFLKAVYTLGSHNKALDLDLLQRDIGYNIDPLSGSILSPYDYTIPRTYKASFFPSGIVTEEAVQARFDQIKNS
ncbi:hypothetical protein M2G70_07355 [Vibrio vulnificus]|nr:hypothetical protein [Vibrio vulnificus]